MTEKLEIKRPAGCDKATKLSPTLPYVAVGSPVSIWGSTLRSWPNGRTVPGGRLLFEHGLKLNSSSNTPHLYAASYFFPALVRDSWDA